MRQRLGIAGALVHAPRVAILDEPVSSLDPEGRRDVLNLIAGLRGEITVLFSTHVLADVERICDRVGILAHGRLVVEGPLAELLERYALPVYRIEAEPDQRAGLDALAAELRALSWVTGVGRRARGGQRRRLGSGAGRPRDPRRDRIVGDRRAVRRPRPAHPRGRVPPPDRRRRHGGRGVTGFAVLLRKELAEAWQTRRLPVVAGLFIVIGMISPLTARYLREIMQAALGDQLTIPIPAPTAVMAVEQLQKNLAQLGALAAIALAMGSVAGELDRGTAALVLAQPVTRAAFISAKLAALAIVLGISVGLAAISAWIYTGVLFEPPPIGGWLAMTALSWLALCAWAAITFLASAATGSTTLAAGPRLRRARDDLARRHRPGLRPAAADGLTTPAIVLASGNAGLDAGALFTAVAGTAPPGRPCLGGAILAFRRREL